MTRPALIAAENARHHVRAHARECGRLRRWRDFRGRPDRITAWLITLAALSVAASTIGTALHHLITYHAAAASKEHRP